MASTRREERSLLTHDELALVAPTHHPDITTQDAEALRSMATRLRAEHGKLRDLIRSGRRARAGKGEPRGATNALHARMAEKKQVFAAALKRVNSRFAELTEDRRREEHRAALRAALARKKAMRAQHPQPGHTARKGMRLKGGNARGPKVNPGQIGSVSQQNKAAQARRDA